MRTYVVTELLFRDKKITAGAVFEDMKLSDIRIEKADAGSYVSRIYRGTVDKVSANIHGAFVNIGETEAFLPVSAGEKIRASSPVLVQVTKDAAGVKAPVLTTNLHLSGKYAVISLYAGPVSFSAKLNEEHKTAVRRWLEGEDTGKYRILVRTNARNCSKERFLDELKILSDKMDRILEDYKSASCGELLYQPEPFFISMYRDLYNVPDRCVSDIPSAAAALSGCSGIPSEEIEYERGSRSLSLPSLYRLNETLTKLTGRHVWLKSGAYIVIERTEAFVSIDVNTGKCTRGRNPEETYRRINLEAAEEAADQIRLRNLSGMILIDFISMESEDNKTELLHLMKKLVRKDHIFTDVVDITPLGIMEIIRQKVRKPLEEELGLC